MHCIDRCKRHTFASSNHQALFSLIMRSKSIHAWPSQVKTWEKKKNIKELEEREEEEEQKFSSNATKVTRPILTAVMLLSFYTHVLFLISAVIFSCSFISFIQRLPFFNGVFRTPTSLSMPSIVSFDEHLSMELQQHRREQLRIRERLTPRQPLNHSGLGKKVVSVLDRFTFVNPPHPICDYAGNREQYLIFVVLSRASNFDFRQAIRATWGRNGKLNRNRIYVQTVFFVGTNDGFQTPIRMEQDMFNDVVEIGKSQRKLVFGWSAARFDR